MTLPRFPDPHKHSYPSGLSQHFLHPSHALRAVDTARFQPYFPTVYNNRSTIGQAPEFGPLLPMSNQGDRSLSQLDSGYVPLQPLQYGPIQAGDLASYGCHCTECTNYAEVGWTNYIDQAAIGPFQYQPSAFPGLPQYTSQGRQSLPSINTYHYPHQTYPPQLPNNSTSHTASESGNSASEQSESSVPLIAPRDIFGNPSPVPLLSECSTCSTSGSFGRPTFGGDFNDWQIYNAGGAGDPWAIRRSGGWSSVQDFKNTSETATSSYSNDPPSETDNGSRYSPRIQAASDYDVNVAYKTSTPKPQVDDYWQHLDDRDRLLVEWKLDGMSYRDIKARGGFTEAESTLRGRFRALTKEPDQRVRKPRWTRRDIKLLREAVAKLSTPAPSYHTIPTRLRSRSASPLPSSARRPHKSHRRQQSLKLKTPWKDVADYIVEHGGSYRFGNATCRKKWDEIVADDEGASDD